MSILSSALERLALLEKSRIGDVQKLASRGGALFKDLSPNQIKDIANAGQNVAFGGGVSLASSLIKGGEKAVSGLSIKLSKELPQMIQEALDKGAEFILKSRNFDKTFASKVGNQVAKELGFGEKYSKLIGQNLANKVAEMTAKEAKQAAITSIEDLTKLSTRRNIPLLNREISKDLAKEIGKDLKKFDMSISSNADFGLKSEKALLDLSNRMPPRIVPDIPKRVITESLRNEAGNVARTVGGESTSVDADALRKLADFREAKRLKGMRVQKFNPNDTALVANQSAKTDKGIIDAVFSEIPNTEKVAEEVVNKTLKDKAINFAGKHKLLTAIGGTIGGTALLNRILGDNVDNNAVASQNPVVTTKKERVTGRDEKLQKEVIRELLKLSRGLIKK